MGQSYDHYVSRAHMRQWATDNRVTVLRRDAENPKPLDIGKAIAAEQGLNSPSIEAAYGRIENAFARALPRLLDSFSTPTNLDWQAVRKYAVLVHDRYPALRGSAVDENGLPGGNAMMVPNPAHWGGLSGVSDHLAHLATTMDREQLKAARLQLLPVFAQSLPPMAQVFHVGPMLLGDAGIHAITLHPDDKTNRSCIAMPLSSNALVVFGNQSFENEDAREIEHVLRMKVAMESTVVVDTPDAPVIRGLVMQMWRYQPRPSGMGAPKAIHVWSRPEDIPDSRCDEGQSSIWTP
ncbi:DUF4238 domain-containing protein [Cryobacterium sp. 10S3]|uniref:DUF4238 domain-containing protein n=1 Tax=Cryobacterium sp. 10S3 TaxID=3048582 RepID=UPI002AC9CF1B|nr:DUF4238 domain-containing protein [Cryobacterium sp. 10S3]MEB0288498.1 DUF4238 domain-containing protein [Cryobacterium sp. 10S3]WPX13142.1 DUF4238 domain-containing protein [Cryobacterium sp. 10S3]